MNVVMNTNVLKALEKRAEETSTMGLAIWHDGQIVTCFGENKKVPLYSTGKLHEKSLDPQDLKEILRTPSSKLSFVGHS